LLTEYFLLFLSSSSFPLAFASLRMFRELHGRTWVRCGTSAKVIVYQLRAHGHAPLVAFAFLLPLCDAVGRVAGHRRCANAFEIHTGRFLAAFVHSGSFIADDQSETVAADDQSETVAASGYVAMRLAMMAV